MQPNEARSRPPDEAAYTLAVAGVLALLARHRWPVPVLAATLIAFGAYHLLDYPAGPPILAVVVAVYGTAASGRLSVALGAGGLVTGSGIIYRALVEGDNVHGIETTLGATLLVTAALLGDATPSRQSRADQPTDPGDRPRGQPWP